MADLLDLMPAVNRRRLAAGRPALLCPRDPADRAVAWPLVDWVYVRPEKCTGRVRTAAEKNGYALVILRRGRTAWFRLADLTPIPPALCHAGPDAIEIWLAGDQAPPEGDRDAARPCDSEADDGPDVA